MSEAQEGDISKPLPLLQAADETATNESMALASETSRPAAPDGDTGASDDEDDLLNYPALSQPSVAAAPDAVPVPSLPAVPRPATPPPTAKAPHETPSKTEEKRAASPEATISATKAEGRKRDSFGSAAPAARPASNRIDFSSVEKLRQKFPFDEWKCMPEALVWYKGQPAIQVESDNCCYWKIPGAPGGALERGFHVIVYFPLESDDPRCAFNHIKVKTERSADICPYYDGTGSDKGSKNRQKKRRRVSGGGSSSGGGSEAGSECDDGNAATAQSGHADDGNLNHAVVHRELVAESSDCAAVPDGGSEPSKLCVAKAPVPATAEFVELAISERIAAIGDIKASRRSSEDAAGRAAATEAPMARSLSVNAAKMAVYDASEASNAGGGVKDAAGGALTSDEAAAATAVDKTGLASDCADSCGGNSRSGKRGNCGSGGNGHTTSGNGEVNAGSRSSDDGGGRGGEDRSKWSASRISTLSEKGTIPKGKKPRCIPFSFRGGKAEWRARVSVVMGYCQAVLDHALALKAEEAAATAADEMESQAGEDDAYSLDGDEDIEQLTENLQSVDSSSSRRREPATAAGAAAAAAAAAAGKCGSSGGGGSGGACTGPPELRAGDRIRYFDPRKGAVREALMEARIVEIREEEASRKLGLGRLVLDNSEPLLDTHQVTLISTRDNHVDRKVTHSFFPICECVLISGKADFEIRSLADIGRQVAKDVCAGVAREFGAGMAGFVQVGPKQKRSLRARTRNDGGATAGRTRDAKRISSSSCSEDGGSSDGNADTLSSSSKEAAAAATAAGTAELSLSDLPETAVLPALDSPAKAKNANRSHSPRRRRTTTARNVNRTAAADVHPAPAADEAVALASLSGGSSIEAEAKTESGSESAAGIGTVVKRARDTNGAKRARVDAPEPDGAKRARTDAPRANGARKAGANAPEAKGIKKAQADAPEGKSTGKARAGVAAEGARADAFANGAKKAEADAKESVKTRRSTDGKSQKSASNDSGARSRPRRGGAAASAGASSAAAAGSKGQEIEKDDVDKSAENHAAALRKRQPALMVSLRPSAMTKEPASAGSRASPRNGKMAIPSTKDGLGAAAAPRASSRLQSSLR